MCYKQIESNGNYSRRLFIAKYIIKVIKYNIKSLIYHYKPKKFTKINSRGSTTDKHGSLEWSELLLR